LAYASGVNISIDAASIRIHGRCQALRLIRS
jgi:hypothetical protein